MSSIFFHLEVPQGYELIKIIEAIQELMFPGTHVEVLKEYLWLAEKYYGTDAWHALFNLGHDHQGPYQYYNGVVVTWSSLLLNQPSCTKPFGVR